MSDDALGAAMRRRGADVADVDGRVVARHFGDAAAEYRALREAAGLVDLPWIERLRVTGGDRVGFLQGMLSNDVAKLAVGAGCRALLLSEQGKVLADLIVLASDDALALDGIGTCTTVRAALERFIVADDVELSSPSAAARTFVILGPAAAAVLARLGLPVPLEVHAHAPATMPEREPHVVRISWPADGGFLCRVPAAGVDAWWDRCIDVGGARAVGFDALEALRIESGVPWYGRDVQSDTLALEAPYEDAISFSKGCYLGQEVMERVTARGHVNRKLVGVAVAGDVVPAGGARLFAAERDVGWVTSAARSWRLGRIIGLAYVRREHLEAGTRLALGAPGGADATVHSLPF